MNDISVEDVTKLTELYRKLIKIKNFDSKQADLMEKIVYISQYSLLLSDSIDKVDIELYFAELLTQWEEGTKSLSSISAKINHPAYIQIIEIGTNALPLILKSLSNKPDHWFIALSKITSENPVTIGATFEEAVSPWLQWGQDNNLLK